MKPLAQALAIALVAGTTGLATAPVYAEYGEVDYKHIGSQVVAGDFFGSSVALEGNLMVVGASSGDAVYLFERNADGTWSEVEDFSGAANSEFGAAVAISGNNVAIGAPAGNGGKGEVRVYTYNEQSQIWSTATVMASDGAAGDRFGSAVALTDAMLVVGAHEHAGEDGTESGAVYIYESDTVLWDTETKLDHGNANDWFGYSVAAENDLIVVGAVRHGANGAVFTYQPTEPPQPEDAAPRALVAELGWTPLGSTMASDGADSDFFGSSLALDNGRLLVGASNDDTGEAVNSGSAYLFEATELGWSEVQKLTADTPATGDRFGDSVAISDGFIAAGAFGANGQGAVFIFGEDSPGVWSQQDRVTATDTTTGDNFGNAVALDGNVLVAAAKQDDDNGDLSGAVWTFEHATDLTVSISDDSTKVGQTGYVQPGDTLTYTITVTNNDSEVTATGVTLTDNLPVASVQAARVDGQAAICDSELGTISCPLPDLAPGDSVEVQLDILVPLAAVDPAPELRVAPTVVLSNSASASSNELDAANLDNSANISTTVNSVPVANADSFDAVDNTELQDSLSGSDGDQDPLTFEAVSQPSNGTLVIQANGDFSYTPDDFFTGPDSFSFRVYDGKQYSDAATVNVTVRLDPRPPVAADVQTTTNEDTAASATLSASDPNLDPMSFSVTRQPQHGSASVDANGLWTYIPANRSADYQVDFEITVTANGQSAIATVTVDVTADDDAPVFDPVTPGTADELTGGTGSVSATDPDEDHDTIAYSIDTQSALGTAGIDPQTGDWSYTGVNRASNYSGDFVVQAESNGLTVTATVLVAVTASSEAPTATSASITTDEDTASAGQAPKVTDGDEDDSHTFTIESQPVVLLRDVGPEGNPGIASVVNNQLVFTPSADWYGDTSFTFRATDAAGNSVVGVADVTVSPVNDPASSVSASIATDEDTPSAPTSATVVDVDDESGHAISILTQPSNGVASMDGNQLVYTPNANFEGSDSFTIRATDEGLESADGTVTVTVNPVNDPPTATSASISTAEDTASTPVTPDVADVDATDTYTVSLTLVEPASAKAFVDVLPQNGVASVVNNQLVYTPNANYVGNDSFTYYVTDSGGYVVQGTATVTVGGDNDPPSSAEATIVTDEDTVSAPVAASVVDVDDSEHTISIFSQPTHGSAEVVGNQLVYTPHANYHGGDSFQFRATDDENGSVIGIATVTVNSVNDVPSSTSAAIATVEDADVALVDPVVSDADSGDSHVFTIVTDPANGTAAVRNNQLLYTPKPNFFGNDTFQFRATDSAGASVEGEASVVVTAVNDVPTSTSASITTDEDTTSAGVTPSVEDVDDSSHSFSVSTQPANGTASVVNNQLVYTPNANFHGSDSFGFVAADAAGTGVNGVASVTVNSVNDSPTLLTGNTNGLIVQLDGTVRVSFNVSDNDVGDSHSYSVGVSAQSSSIGNASFEGSTLVFTGTTVGSETLTVTVTDGAGASDSFQLPVTVEPVPVDDANSDGLSDGRATALGLDPAATGGDSDGDGTPDVQEIGSLDNPTDSDGDGIIDALEEGDAANDAGKLSFRIPQAKADELGLSGLGNGPVTLQAGTGQTLSVPADIGSVALASGNSGMPTDSSYEFPLGIYGFSVNTGGSRTATVILTFPAGTVIPAGAVVRKLDANDVWRNYPSDRHELDRDARTLELTLYDNDEYDRDSALGVIRDPVGLGSAKASSDSGDSGGGAGSPWALLGLALMGLWTRLRRKG